MYRLVGVTMLPSYKFVGLPDCHSGHSMSELKNRIRSKLEVPPGVHMELGYADETGNIVSVSNDDTVEQVVQAIIQVHLEPCFITQPILVSLEAHSLSVTRH